MALERYLVAPLVDQVGRMVDRRVARLWGLARAEAMGMFPSPLPGMRRRPLADWLDEGVPGNLAHHRVTVQA